MGIERKGLGEGVLGENWQLYVVSEQLGVSKDPVLEKVGCCQACVAEVAGTSVTSISVDQEDAS